MANLPLEKIADFSITKWLTKATMNFFRFVSGRMKFDNTEELPLDLDTH